MNCHVQMWNIYSNTLRSLRVLTVLSLVWAGLNSDVKAGEWTLPLAGNAFRTAPASGDDGTVRRGDGIAWQNAQHVYSIFFHIDRPAKLSLSLTADRQAAGDCFAVKTDGQSQSRAQQFSVCIPEDVKEAAGIGTVEVPGNGYVHITLQGTKRNGRDFGPVQTLRIESETPDLKVDFVRDNRGGMYYWGRRGPSVHLSYVVPADVPLEYAYCEITVPAGADPVGSFFMANGFGQGYFGFQVNSPRERRVLFSVWSPFRTDNPAEIPPDQRVTALARGQDVHVGEFGNEGSGGQSFLVYPWRAGRTYRFLTRVRPDGPDSTEYTSWFGDKAAGEWRLIARFRRPKTNTTLRGFHSFLESFSPATGWQERRALYGNVHVRDRAGKWYTCRKARFSVDATGGGHHRLDFAGGTEGTAFFLRNCGFFNETGRPGQVFERDAAQESDFDLDVASLPER